MSYIGGRSILEVALEIKGLNMRECYPVNRPRNPMVKNWRAFRPASCLRNRVTKHLRAFRPAVYIRNRMTKNWRAFRPAKCARNRTTAVITLVTGDQDDTWNYPFSQAWLRATKTTLGITPFPRMFTGFSVVFVRMCGETVNEKLNQS